MRPRRGGHGFWRAASARGPAGRLHRALRVSSASRPRRERGTRCRARPSGGWHSKWPARVIVPSTTTPIRSRNICGGTPLHLHVRPGARPSATSNSSVEACPATDRARRRPAAEADGGADRLVAGGVQLGRPPVVDEVLADAADGDRDERERAATATAPTANQRPRLRSVRRQSTVAPRARPFRRGRWRGRSAERREQTGRRSPAV